MAAIFSDMQASLLYEVEPDTPLNTYFDALCTRAGDMGLTGTFQVLKDASTNRRLALGGAGLHAFITLRDTPCDASDFDPALRAPILRFKSFDFKAAVNAHTAALIVTVGDGEKPLPVQDRQALSPAGLKPAPLTHKLALLHVLLSCIAQHNPPSMVNFSPTQSLLSPDEFYALSDMPLPLPILFHPYPLLEVRDENGATRMGMVAIHAQHLIGAELALENAPDTVHVTAQVALLTKLIAGKQSGVLPLNDGDTVEVDQNLTLRLRHEPSTDPDASHKIIARFENTLIETPKAERPPGQQAFQDRIARLKTRTDAVPPAAPAGQNPAADTASESPDELRQRVQMAISSGVETAPARRRFALPYAVGLLGLLAGYFVLSQDGQIDTVATAFSNPLGQGQETISEQQRPLNSSALPRTADDAFGKTVPARGTAD